MEAGLAEFLGGRVRFRHPLTRLTAYRSASLAQRQQTHAALAEVTDPITDPDRRAWHRAQAAPGPDEDVSAELERSACWAQARGGLAAAAAFLQRSVALSADPGQRTGRALAAAEACLSAGVYEPALATLAVAESSPLDDLQRGRMELLHGMAAYAQRRGSDALPLLLKAAKTLETLDPQLARDTYLDAWSAALFAGKLATAGSMYHICRGGAPGPARRRITGPSDLLLDGLALILTDGRRAATPFLRRASAGVADPDAPGVEALRWGWLATVGAVLVWDYDSCLAISSRTVRLARDLGALTVLAVALNILTEAVTMGGEFGVAERLIAEADAVTERWSPGTAVLGALTQGVPGPCGGRVADQRRHGQGSHRGRPGHRHRVHRPRPGGRPQRPRPLPRGAAPGQDAADATPELAVAGWGFSSWSRRRRSAVKPNWPAAPSNGSRNVTASSRPTGATGSWPARGRCSPQERRRASRRRASSVR